MEVAYDQKVRLPDSGFIPADPEREFAGWKLGGAMYAAQQEVENLTDVDGRKLELVAQWKYKDYSGTSFTITLHDGDGKTEQFKANYGQSVPVTSSLTKAHYHLVGWARTQGGSVWLAAGETLSYSRPSQLAADLGQQAELYAVWEKDRHTVSFTGTSPAPNSVTVEYGSTIQLPAAPQRTGYVFEGWYTDMGQAWQEASDVVEQDMSLTARYRAAQFTVKFEGNGADGGSMSEMQVTYDQAQNLAQNGYTRPWHDFVGWALTPNGSAEVMDQADASYLSATDGDTVALYAVWKRQQAEVTVTVEGTQHRYQNDLGTVLNIPVPQRTGWKFVAWKNEQDGSLWQESTLVTGPLSLTAEFEPIRYTVVFSGAGAANSDAMATVKIELTYDQKTDLPTNLYTRAGYKFLGWSRTPGGRVEFADGVSVSALTEKDGATVTLYAVWQAPEAPSNSSQNTQNAGKEESTVSAGTPAPQAVTENVAVEPRNGNFTQTRVRNERPAAPENPAEENRDEAAKPAPQEEAGSPQQELPAADVQQQTVAQQDGESSSWGRILALAMGAVVLAGGGLFGTVNVLRRKNR